MTAPNAADTARALDEAKWAATIVARYRASFEANPDYCGFPHDLLESAVDLAAALEHAQARVRELEGAARDYLVKRDAYNEHSSSRNLDAMSWAQQAVRDLLAGSEGA